MGVGFPGDQLLHIFLMRSVIVVHVHGPELQERKRHTVLPNALLSIEHWPFRRKLHKSGNQQEDWSANYESYSASYNINHSLNGNAVFTAVIQFREIRIESRVAGPVDRLTIPTLRVHVKRNADPVQLVERQRLAQCLTDAVH